MEEKAGLDLNSEKETTAEKAMWDFHDKFYKFGVMITPDKEVKALTRDGDWTTWFDRDGFCKGNTDQLNIWLSERAEGWGMPTCEDAMEMVEGIANFYGIAIPEAQLGKVIDLEDFAELQCSKVSDQAENLLGNQTPVSDVGSKLKDIFSGKGNDLPEIPRGNNKWKMDELEM